LFCALAALALLGSSCGGNGLHPVSGKVLYRGDPAAGAVVYFQRTSANPMNEHTIMGLVGKDGTFTLVCGHLGTGAPAGEYDVLIEWPHVSKQPKGLARKGHDRLNGRYADPKRPRLHAVVKAEANNLPPFELKD
jgi:hypothetical protein